MAKTAVLNKETKDLIAVVTTAADKKEFDGRDDVEFVTKKGFEASDKYKSWEEMIGEAKPVEEPQEAEAKAKRETTPLADESQYHLLKPFPATADDHPKKPIWTAIEKNNNGTIADAKADCPKENPKRKTRGVYTFSSEFRYFLKAGYVALGAAPDGHDHTKVEEKPVKEKKPRKAKKETAAASDEAQNHTESATA